MKTKLLKALAQIASQSPMHPQLACVKIGEGVAVATDSFRLVEVPTKEYTETAIGVHAKALCTLKAKDTFSIDEHGIPFITTSGGLTGAIGTEDMYGYPKYQKLIPDADSKEYASVLINAEYLIEVLQVLRQMNFAQRVVIGVPILNSNKPLTVRTAEGGVGVVMPLMR